MCVAIYLKQKHLGYKKVALPKKTATKMTDIRMWPRFISQSIIGCAHNPRDNYKFAEMIRL